MYWCEVARHAYADNLTDCYIDIPASLPRPQGHDAALLYYIGRERKRYQERIKLAMGGREDKPNVIEVIPIACDECPISRYEVGVDCRGCIAHRCRRRPAGAIRLTRTRRRASIPSAQGVRQVRGGMSLQRDFRAM